MSLTGIRTVKNILRAASGTIFGRVDPNIGKGQELSPKQVTDLILPDQTGRINEALLTDGDGNLSWGVPTTSSVDVFHYRFSTVTIPPPPTSNIRYNNTIISLVTAAYVAKESDGGIDLTNYYRKITPGTVFWMQDEDDAARYQRWSITTVQEHAAYFEWGILMLDQGLLVSNNARVITSYVRVGQDGVQLNDLLDVILISPAAGQNLTYDGTNWVNSAPVMNTTTQALIKVMATRLGVPYETLLNEVIAAVEDMSDG